MKRMHVAAIATAALFLFIACQQPEPALVGKVLDPQGQPIQGATVKLADGQTAVQTDAQGAFALPYKPGKLRVLVENQNYEARAVPLSLDKLTRYDMGTITLRFENNPRAVETVVMAMVEGQVLYNMKSQPPTYAGSLACLASGNGAGGEALLRPMHNVTRVGGSEIEMVPGQPNEQGVIPSFVVRTKPIQYPDTGTISFYADETAARMGDNGGQWGTKELPLMPSMEAAAGDEAGLETTGAPAGEQAEGEAGQ